MNKDKNETVFFCGIGGSGMSALAHILNEKGYEVIGSDRSHDRGETPEKFKLLSDKGIRLVPQDGAGINSNINRMVVSTAVEDSIPDVQVAKSQNVPIVHRSDILSELFHSAEYSIGVGGTSGKSTTTGLIGWILKECGRDPTIINGAPMNNFRAENIQGSGVIGTSKLCIAELDESDGSIVKFKPSIGVLTNISLDHKPLEELMEIFGDYLLHSDVSVMNYDDKYSMQLAAKATKLITFSLKNEDADYVAENIREDEAGSVFDLVIGENTHKDVRVPVPGIHNIYNSLSAIATVLEYGLDIDDVIEALSAYKGIHRRFEDVGTFDGVRIIDDFAHNPDKIRTTMQVLSKVEGKVFYVFQPHGFRPTKLMESELVTTFTENLRSQDCLIMPEIYYAGGTANKVISSKDITLSVENSGKNAYFIEKRSDISGFIAENAQKDDVIVIMGARDDTLPAFALDIGHNLMKRHDKCVV